MRMARGWGAFWAPFYKDMNPIHEGSCPPNHLQSLYLLLLSPWGLGFNIKIQTLVQPNYSAIIFPLLEFLETFPPNVPVICFVGV